MVDHDDGPTIMTGLLSEHYGTSTNINVLSCYLVNFVVPYSRPGVAFVIVIVAIVPFCRFCLKLCASSPIDRCHVAPFGNVIVITPRLSTTAYITRIIVLKLTMSTSRGAAHTRTTTPSSSIVPNRTVPFPSPSKIQKKSSTPSTNGHNP